jgi:hypothetical protein
VQQEKLRYFFHPYSIKILHNSDAQKYRCLTVTVQMQNHIFRRSLKKKKKASGHEASIYVFIDEKHPYESALANIGYP